MYIKLSEPHKQQIREALLRVCDIPNNEALNAIIDDIEKNGCIPDFGYGSLIKVPHTTEGITREKGMLNGYSGRFNVAFRFYGATHENPSLIFGLEPNKNGFISGMITKKSIFKDGESPSIEGILEFINNFQTRECPPGNSIYKFPFVQVEDENGEKIWCVTCQCDPEGDQYVGEALTLNEKAIIIANEWGAQINPANGNDRLPHQKTLLNYFREVIDAQLKCGFEIEDELMELLELASYYRLQMSENKQTFLAAIESGQFDENTMPFDGHKSSNALEFYDAARQKERDLRPDVFYPAPLEPLTAEENNLILSMARKRLRNILKMPPLPPKYIKPMISMKTAKRSTIPLHEAG